MELLLVREPIFDGDGDLFGYELRHSIGYATSASGGDEPEAAALVHSLLESHLSHVTRGKPAFVRATLEMIEEGLISLLPRSRVVVQIPADLESRADLLITCRQLYREGYRFAIDGFAAAPEPKRLVDIARYLRVDADEANGSLAAAVKKAAEFNRPAIATGIDTVERWKECRELGFRYFQGRFFKSSDRMSVRGTPAQSIHILRLLKLARDPKNSNRELVTAIKADPTLTFKLLKLVNSAAMGGVGIQSIGHALNILGRIPLQRWLTVLLVVAMRGQGGYDQELAVTALVRGRFLELLAEASDGEIDDGPAFLVGLFSVMDALVKLPMEEVVETAGLPPIVCEALLERVGLFGHALDLVEAYEEGDWPKVSQVTKRLPMDGLDLSAIYAQAVSWAKSQLTV